MDEFQRSQAHWPVLLTRLQERLSYRFTHIQWLEEALTHRSYGQPHNERFEFLGDAVLNLLIAQQLFERFPKLDEGSYLVLAQALSGNRRWPNLRSH